MNKKEEAKYLLDLYSGILFNNQTFEDGNNKQIKYNFECKEYKILKEKYNLDKIAGLGSYFIRAKRLLHYLAPKLKHLSNYDNHIPCNSLDLLEYSLNNPDHGINCLNKSKILEECCLAIGIYARRVCIMPYSPYDCDNHVVTEIYDRDMKKWIMLDPTTDGLFIDENKTPLSLIEIRDKFANMEYVSFTPSINKINNLEKLKEKYIEQSAYICKNLFYFYIDEYSTFGDMNKRLCVAPKSFSTKERLIANNIYRIKNANKSSLELISKFKNNIKYLKENDEPQKTNVSLMIDSPF